MFKRIEKWRRLRKEKKMMAKIADLREFVYLDEVSVTSLLSSRLGAIPNEFKDTLTDSSTAEIGSRLEGDAIFAKARAESKIQAVQTTNRQVVRKATIQATFKDFYEKERTDFAVRPARPDESAPKKEEIQKILNSNAKEDEFQLPWIIDPEKLSRGLLAEINVELHADPIYRLSAIISTMGELFKESKIFSSQVDGKTVGGIAEINVVLQKLMVGLIPI